MSDAPQPEMSLDDLYDFVGELYTRRMYQRASYFHPYPKQFEFFRAGLKHDERLLMAANQVGKSIAAGFETACHLTGNYPDWWPGRRWDKPTEGWLSNTTGTAVRDIAQSILCGPFGNAELFGSGMIPKDAFVGPPTLARGVPDAYDTIRVRHKSGGISVANFKTYSQTREEWQGRTLDWLWPDEEIPMQLYSEGRTRLVVRHGMSYMTYTPLKGQTDVTLRFTDEDAPNRVMIKMGLVDALHFTPQQRQEKIDSYPASERQARAYGDPMMGEGRVFTTPAEQLTMPIKMDEVPLDWVKLWGIDFGINHPFAAVLMAWDREYDPWHCYVLKTIRMSDAVVVQHANAMREIAPNVPVAWPHDGHERDKQSGTELAVIYRRHNLNMLGEHATHPTGGYSTYAGVTQLEELMNAARFHVNASEHQWFEEYGNYHYDKGKLVKIRDDLMSATRIGHMMRRKARAVPLGREPGFARRRRQTIAEGLDFPLFG